MSERSGDKVRHSAGTDRHGGHEPAQRVRADYGNAGQQTPAPGFLAYGLAGDCPQGAALRAAGVGARLRLTRLARELSALALAQLADTSHTAVGNIERGGTMPTIATVEALAKALDISPAWLAYGVGDREVPPRRRSQAAQSPDTPW